MAFPTSSAGSLPIQLPEDVSFHAGKYLQGLQSRLALFQPTEVHINNDILSFSSSNSLVRFSYQLSIWAEKSDLVNIHYEIETSSLFTLEAIIMVVGLISSKMPVINMLALVGSIVVIFHFANIAYIRSLVKKTIAQFPPVFVQQSSENTDWQHKFPNNTNQCPACGFVVRYHSVKCPECGLSIEKSKADEPTDWTSKQDKYLKYIFKPLRK
jgi:hypothetical protein